MRYPAGDQCPECGSRLHLEGNTDAGESWYDIMCVRDCDLSEWTEADLVERAVIALEARYGEDWYLMQWDRELAAG